MARSDRIPTVVERLEAVTGRTPYWPRFGPLDELICCILSQHTNDASSIPAFFRLKERFPEWDLALRAGPAGIAEPIRQAGLANQKSKTIARVLAQWQESFGGFSDARIHELSTSDALALLTSFPGVGPKTAAIVACFALGRDVLPVDTHVYRVSLRLGILNEDIGEVKAHQVLGARIPSGWAFRYHVQGLAHGRTVCRARVPECATCVLVSECRYWRLRSRGAKAPARPTSARGRGSKRSPGPRNTSPEPPALSDWN